MNLGRCAGCGTYLRSPMTSVRCPRGCQRPVALKPVRHVRKGALTACGAACQNATTTRCDCVCGGRRHGAKAGYYVHGDVQRVADWRSWRARPAEWQGFTINFPELREGLDDDNDPDGGNLGVFGVREHEIRDLQNLYVPVDLIIPTEHDKRPEHIERVGAAIIRNRRVDAIIIVRRAVPGSALRLEHGHHRYLALRARGFQTIPASVVWTTAKGSTTVPGLAAGDAAPADDPAKPTLWFHLTDRARFKLDRRYTPQDNSVSVVDRSGRPGIYLASSVEKWVNGYGYWRPFVVEFAVDPSVADDPGAHGRWGGEMFVPATSFNKLNIQRVIPLDAYAREHYREPGWIESARGVAFDTGEPVDRHTRYPGYRYPGPDVREMSAPEVARLRKQLHQTKRSRHGDVGIGDAARPRIRSPLRVGSFVYHGTAIDRDIKMLRGPAWVSNHIEPARDFSTRFMEDEEGGPRILTFRVKAAPKLAIIDSDKDWETFKEWALPGGDHIEIMELAEAVCAKGLDGWHITDNYKPGSDTLLCEPGRWLELVRTVDARVALAHPPYSANAAKPTAPRAPKPEDNCGTDPNYIEQERHAELPAADAQGFVTMYHGTALAQLPNIRKRGLRPSAYVRGKGYSPYVFLAVQCHEARFWGGTKGQHGSDRMRPDAVVLAVRVPRDHIFRDTVTGYWVTNEDIPPSRIRVARRAAVRREAAP